jgi:hypothetical protein
MGAFFFNLTCPRGWRNCNLLQSVALPRRSAKHAPPEAGAATICRPTVQLDATPSNARWCNFVNVRTVYPSD